VAFAVRASASGVYLGECHEFSSVADNKNYIMLLARSQIDKQLALPPREVKEECKLSAEQLELH
jgi:hypothetical protein